MMRDDDLIKRVDVMFCFDDDMTIHQARKSIAALPAAPAQPVAVTVKPLVWSDCEIENWDVFECLTILGRYKVQKFVDRDYALLVLPNGSITRHQTIDAAKAAAQADYEARIMAALNVQPITVHDAAKVPEIAALINASKVVHSSYWNDSDGIIRGMFDLGEALSAIAGEDA